MRQCETTRASTTAPTFTGTSTFENAVVSGTLNNGTGVSYALSSDHYTKGEVDNQIGGLGIVYYNKTEVDDKLTDGLATKADISSLDGYTTTAFSGRDYADDEIAFRTINRDGPNVMDLSPTAHFILIRLSHKGMGIWCSLIWGHYSWR